MLSSQNIVADNKLKNVSVGDKKKKNFNISGIIKQSEH